MSRICDEKKTKKYKGKIKTGKEKKGKEKGKRKGKRKGKGKGKEGIKKKRKRKSKTVREMKKNKKKREMEGVEGRLNYAHRYIFSYLIVFCNTIDMIVFRIMNGSVKTNLSSPRHIIPSHSQKWIGSEFRHEGMMEGDTILLCMMYN